MRRTLSVLLKDVNADWQVRSSRALSSNRPSKFGPEFSYSSRPFTSILCKILEFFARYRLSDISAQVFENFILDRYVLLPDLIGYVPPVGSVSVRVLVEKYVIVRTKSTDFNSADEKIAFCVH